MSYEYKYVNGHVEVFLHGRFLFSADTKAEAVHELNNKECEDYDY